MYRLNLFFVTCGLAIGMVACTPQQESGVESPAELTALDHFVASPTEHFSFEKLDVLEGDGVTVHVLRMVSGRWLTPGEVEDPEWWHWLTVIVPDSVESHTGLLSIGGGSRNTNMPDSAPEEFVFIAKETGSVVAYLHNVPNQPLTFKKDTFGPRVEDELIAYGWRQFLEGGAVEDDDIWLARLPMTNAAVRAMDAVTAYCEETVDVAVDQYVVMGGSKRGWTTWTTGAVDDRVVAIVPVVIDMLNLVPSFQHHWQAYGFWAPAVDDYVNEGVMEWQESKEYARLLDAVEPYSYRSRLDMPKLLVNATGDQFFLPDSWQFYWNDLVGEKHLRYVPNTGHSLSGSDAFETITAFFHAVSAGAPRPSPDWSVENGAISIQVEPDQSPTEVRLWQASNPDSRDFRIDELGEVWTSTVTTEVADGTYRLRVDPPEEGWTAFFGELTYPGPGTVPLKVTTGVVVVPDALPFPPYESDDPRGTSMNP